jgi:hypothetical protein
MSTPIHRTAVLGWGSLIWDARPEFDRHLTGWSVGGPRLPLESCRISQSRKKALTLVIDTGLGTEVETLYALTTRLDPQDAICDLRCREGTTAKNIGYVNLVTADEHGRCANVVETIRSWAPAKEVHFVVWTDLPANFPERKADKFCNAALSHLKSLDVAGIRAAVEYIANAPPTISTAFRTFIMNDAWFKNQLRLLTSGR